MKDKKLCHQIIEEIKKEKTQGSSKGKEFPMSRQKDAAVVKQRKYIKSL